MTERRNLCYHCADAYRDAGYKLIRVNPKPDAIKDRCDLCNRSQGWEFVIKREDG